CLQYKRYPLTF
nr:immunoglobulin light chain junction region [Macaca mulatta]